MDSTDAGASSPVVEPRQIYLIKPPHYEHPVELEFQIKQAQELLYEINAARALIVQELDFKKIDLEKFSWISSCWPTSYERHQAKYRLEILQPCLAKLSFLDDCEEQIRNLKRQLIHDKIPRQAKEMKIFKELNDLIRTRDVYMVDSSHAEESAKIIERWGSKDKIRQHIEECELRIANSKLFVSSISHYDNRERKRLQRKKASIGKEVRALERKLTHLNKKKARAHESILHLSRLQATIRAENDEYVATLNVVQELVMKKDMMGLQEFTDQMNERFMSKWNKDKGFRQEYKKRAGSSLDSRGLNFDGILIRY